MTNSNLTQLLTTLNLTPKNLHLIENAFVHRSYLNESTNFKESNERLEYLGDAVLELITSDYLYKSYPDYQEGMLTNIRAALVRTESLAEVAENLNFPKIILMSKGEAATGGQKNKSILADAFEAFVGAIYLDLGLSSVEKILKSQLFPKTKKVIAGGLYKDNKSFLQEVSQARFKATPQYNLISEAGPDHDKEFVMQVSINNQPYSKGVGKSKQAAQEVAAKNTLEQILHS
ncbi:MAG: ribonuclease III [Candidatus Microgenomates bacterium]